MATSANRYLHVAPNLRSQWREHEREWAREPSSTFVAKTLQRPDKANPDYIRSRYQTAGCTRCPLACNRRKVVLYRGYLPCDVLFIGEAPGESEDALGFPFVGPAGKLLTELWQDSINQQLDKPKFGITNIVACIPRQPAEMETGEIRPPTKEEAAACQPRLLEIIKLANPKLICLLGDIAKRFFPTKMLKPPLPKLLNLVHPSAILRQESASITSLMEKRFVLSLSQALRDL